MLVQDISWGALNCQMLCRAAVAELRPNLFKVLLTAAPTARTINSPPARGLSAVSQGCSPL